MISGLYGRLYVYEKDPGGFWVSLGVYLLPLIYIFTFIIDLVFGGQSELDGTAMVIIGTAMMILPLVFFIPLWIWAMIDTVIRPRRWYNQYYEDIVKLSKPQTSK